MFYDFKINIYEQSKETNLIGQSLSSYRKAYSIFCDIQPSSSEIARKTFGEDIDSLYTIFCDENLKVGTVIDINGDTYRINAKVDWITYRIYSVVNADVEVAVNDN